MTPPDPTVADMIAERCQWCNSNRYEAALRFEGPHLTWCVHFREEQRGGSDEDRAIAARLRETEEGQ